MTRNRKTGRRGIKPARARRGNAGIPRGRPYTMTSSGGTPIAPRLITSLVYNDSIVDNTLSFRDYKYNLNSLFDPDLTGTGHQPKGFDQIAALYGRYRVYSVTYEIKYAFYAASALPVHCVAVPTNSTTSYTTASQAIEASRSKWGMATQYQTVTLRGRVDLASLNGKSRIAYASDDTTQAGVGASPTETLILHSCVETIDQSTAYQIYHNVKLLFHCEFSDPIQLAQS